MQVGFINYRTHPGELSLQDPDDPAFGLINETKFSLGAGAMLKSDRFMVGLSIPRLLANSLKAQDIQVYQQHFYLFGSYAYVLTERALLKPSILLRAVQGAPLSADLNVAIDINRAYEAGVFTRNFRTLGAQAQISFLEKFRLGYVFELPFNGSVGTQFTTHEVMLSIRTAVLAFHDQSVTTY
jgi:type IX secretion system PorP/SprF family membrane protein